VLWRTYLELGLLLILVSNEEAALNEETEWLVGWRDGLNRNDDDGMASSK
jgi:hypothetical protein